MRKGLIAGLVCLNVALLVALLAGVAVPRADAQVVGAGTDYLLMTGHISSGYDAVWVVELKNGLLLAYKFDKGQKELVPYRGRALRADFRRQED